jgi:hypothetical protein
MKKIDTKTKETYSKNEMKRYLGALAEDFTGKVKGLGEGLKIIMEKQDEQTKILDSHTKILDSHTEMIGTIMEDVSVLKDDMQIVKKELKKKVDYDEFLSLVQRVNKLEAKN